MSRRPHAFGSKIVTLTSLGPSPLGPPSGRRDPQSYRALSDYLLTYSYLLYIGRQFRINSPCQVARMNG